MQIHQITIRQNIRAMFHRNHDLFSKNRASDGLSQSSRYRVQNTQQFINTLYEKSERDLFILCLLIASPTQLAALKKDWVTDINTWWKSVVKPDRLGVIADEFCHKYRLVSKKRAQPNVPQAEEATPSVERIDPAVEPDAEPDKEPHAEPDDHSTRRPLSSNSSEHLTGEQS
ncbi:MAG: hypothetical protein MMC23_009599 [Stictis urceolatum]|nr:hypothetical protein [Stictis urceolata]